MKKVVFSLMCVCLVLSSCSTEGEDVVEVTEELVVYTTEANYPNLLFSEAITQKIINDIDINSSAHDAYRILVEDKANDALGVTPKLFSSITSDNEKEIRAYSDAILHLAIKWHIGQKASNRQNYIKKAADLLIKLAKGNVATDHTPRETAYLNAYEGYSLIKKALPDNERVIIDSWIEKRYSYFDKMILTGNLKNNNWETIRINFLVYYAVVLNNQNYYAKAIEEAKGHLVNNVLSDGKTIDFVHRDAFAYHAYDLAYWGRILRSSYQFEGHNAATSLMTFKTSEHGSLQDAVDFWMPYLLNPSDNIHLEFVNTQWAPDKNRSDYNKPFNPLAVLYALDELAFVSEKIRNVINTLKGEISPNEHSLKYWISTNY